MLAFFKKPLRLPFARKEKLQQRGKVAPACGAWRLEMLEHRIVLSGTNWSEYNYDAAGTRDNTAEHILNPSNVGNLQVQWEFATQGVVAGTPAVFADTVYAGDSVGNFYALSRSGQLLWETKVNGPITDSPLVVDNTVIFGTQGNFAADQPGAIYGLDARTGKVEWETQPQPNDPLSQIWGSATLVGDNVAIGVASDDELASPQPPPTSRGSLVLLDPHNGHIVWQTYTISDADFKAGATGAAIWSTPAYDPTLGLIYAGTGNNYSMPTTADSDAMMAFNAKTGAIVWVNQRTNNDDWDNHFNASAPDFDFGDSPHIYNLADGETVVGSGQKSGFYWVFDATTGKVVNIQSNGLQGLQVVPGSALGGLFATAAVDPKTDVVYANAHVPTNDSNAFPATGELAAISGDGLNVLWDVTTPSADQSGVALANGVVYFQDLGGTFYAVDASTGKVLAQLFTGGADSGPSVSHGQIFVGQGNILAHGNDSPGGIVALGLSPPEKNVFVQTNLVSDVAGQAQVTDPNLTNPWGVSESTTSPFWVSDQGTNVATVYSETSSGISKAPLTVAIPTTSSGPQGPTGQVFNPTSSFDLANGKPAHFIFANLNGTISAWNGGTTATTVVTTSGALYTGLAMGSNAQGNFLYAANNKTGAIDVFDGTFAPVTLGTGGFGTFSDPLLPADLKLAPFNVQNINGELYVTYAPLGHPAQTSATPGEGAVAIFDTSGNFIRQLIVGGQLASPWGMALAPPTFAEFGGDLLVGNFAYGYSEINAYDPTMGQYLGTLTDAGGKAILNPGLWALLFGNGANGGDPDSLYFLAGINSEKDGLFGEIQAPPNQRFVAAAYFDLFGQPGDNSTIVAGESLADFAAQLDAGMSRAAFAAALVHSADYDALVVRSAYENYLGRDPDAAGLSYWVAQMQAGLTDEQLEASFIGSAEFYANAGGTDAGWLTALYEHLLDRAPDAAGQAFWLAQLAGGESRAQVALGFTSSLERETARVTADYQHFLGRLPDQAGINFWVSEFAQRRMTNEDVIAGFLASDEYFKDHTS